MICDYFLLPLYAFIVLITYTGRYLPWYMCQNWLLASFCHCSTVVSFDAFVRWVAMPYHDTFVGVFVQINDELNWEIAL